MGTFKRRLSGRPHFQNSVSENARGARFPDLPASTAPPRSPQKSRQFPPRPARSRHSSFVCPGTAAQTQAACAQSLPTLPADVVETLIARGIVHGQGGHQNNPTAPLGASALDGDNVRHPCFG